MKQRIGSRIYDTETSEKICSVGEGILFRKKTRGREWFILMDGGTILPLEEWNPLIPEDLRSKPDPAEYRVRLDRSTYDQINAAAVRDNISMAEVVRRLAQNL